MALSSETTFLAASWLSQKPVSPIWDSSSFSRADLLGKSKRVPDRDDPGGEGFDGLGEVFVNHAHSVVRLSDEFQQAECRVYDKTRRAKRIAEGRRDRGCRGERCY